MIAGGGSKDESRQWTWCGNRVQTSRGVATGSARTCKVIDLYGARSSDIAGDTKNLHGDRYHRDPTINKQDDLYVSKLARCCREGLPELILARDFRLKLTLEVLPLVFHPPDQGLTSRTVGRGLRIRCSGLGEIVCSRLPSPKRAAGGCEKTKEATKVSSKLTRGGYLASIGHFKDDLREDRALIPGPS